MSAEDTVVEKFERLLADEGMTFSQLVNKVASKNSVVLNLSDEKQIEFCYYYDQLTGGKLGITEKGARLEQLCAVLFRDNNLFECRRNYKTSTNEIDLLISWSKKSISAGLSDVFPEFGNFFICECKNYKDKVNVTYVGKFYSLLKTSGIKFGVMVAWDGITGRNEWMDSKGLIKKIALKDDIYIVCLDRNDLKKIYQKAENVYYILLNKYAALKSDISYEKYITHHSAEEFFNDL